MKKFDIFAQTPNHEAPESTTLNAVMGKVSAKQGAWTVEELERVSGELFSAVSEYTDMYQEETDLLVDVSEGGECFVMNENGEWVQRDFGVDVLYGKIREFDVEMMPALSGDLTPTLCVSLVSYDNIGHDEEVLVPVAREGEEGVLNIVRQVAPMKVAHETLMRHMEDRASYKRAMQEGVAWESAAQAAEAFLYSGPMASRDMVEALLEIMDHHNLDGDTELLTTAINLRLYDIEREGVVFMVKGIGDHAAVWQHDGTKTSKYIDEHEYLSLLGCEIVRTGEADDMLAVRMFLEPADEEERNNCVFSVMDYTGDFAMVAASTTQNHQ